MQQLAGLALLICAIYYYFHFKKIKRERELTSVEITVYVITQIAIFLWAASSMLLFLDRM
ncbi:hypothetical protein GCM10028868_17420 [Virgibacillus kimchii]